MGRKRNNEYYREARQGEPQETIVARVSGLSSPGRFRDVDLVVRQGEIVGIGGVQGCGKTELVRSIVGLEPYSGGSVEIGGRALNRGSVSDAVALGVAYVPAALLKASSSTTRSSSTLLYQICNAFSGLGAQSSTLAKNGT